MIEIIHTGIAGKIHTMPIRAVELYSDTEWGDIYDANLVIHNLEAESSFRIVPITRNTHWGTIRRLGYKIEANLYVPYNDYGFDYFFDYYFEDLFKSRYSLNLILGKAKAWTENGYDPLPVINSEHGMKISISNYSLNHSIELETVEYRPRTIIRLYGFVKKLNEITFL